MTTQTRTRSGLQHRRTPPAGRGGGFAARREAMFGYLFVAPVVAGIAVFQLYPILMTTVTSLTDWDGISPRHFVGLRNYTTLLFSDELFHRIVRNTFVFMAGAIPLTTLLALVLALLCNRRLPAMGVFRLAFFVPYVANSVAVGFVWYWFYAPDNGVLNGLLAMVGIQGTSWLAQSGWAMVALIVASVWQGVGYPMVVFLAGLQGIPDTLYAAAKVDGAGAWRRLWHVTLPLLTPSTFFVLITQFIGTFQVFGIVFVMTQGGPNNATNVFMLNLYQTAFGAGKVGYASAMAWIMFAVIAAATVIQWKLQRRWVHYD
ncbi:carbohydrate ABC transporter permease [Actinopolymorpha pittospori]